MSAWARWISAGHNQQGARSGGLPATYLPAVEKTGVKVLGIVPMQPDLKNFTVAIFRNVFFREGHSRRGWIEHVVKTIFGGRCPRTRPCAIRCLTKKTVLSLPAVIARHGAGRARQEHHRILLTNNILPPSNIISKASEMNIPLLLVPSDTYQVARQIDAMEPLLTRDNTENINLLTELIKKNVRSRKSDGRVPARGAVNSEGLGRQKAGCESRLLFCRVSRRRGGAVTRALSDTAPGTSPFAVQIVHICFLCNIAW